nr:ABC transporter substrate-binding protein [Amycolatopsis nigrescens]
MVAVGPFAVPAQAQDAQAAKVLRVALVQEIDHLNPFTAGFASSTMIGRLAYEFLTLPSAEDATPSAGLAEKWDPSPDKLTWTYTLRQGVKWSDGKPVTAKDAAYTFNRIMTDEKAAEANGNFVANFETVTAPDDRTLVIKTKEPQASMSSLDVPIVPEHIWSGISDMADERSDTPEVVGVGDGPFLVTEYRKNEVVKLKANPDYWRGKAKVDEIQFIKYENAEAAVNALQNNEIDLVNRLTPTQFEALQGKDGIATNKAPGRRYREMLVNPGAQNVDRQPIGDGNPILKDVRVRKAIGKAVDSQTIVDKVVGGYGQPATGLIPPVFPEYHLDAADSQKPPFDLAAANRELDAAGYLKGQDGIRVAPDGKRLEFRLTGRASENFAQRAADYVVGWLGEAGIKVNKQLVSDNEVDEVTSAGLYDLAFSGYATNPDPDYTLSKQTCAKLPLASGSGSSASLFCDEEFDRLYGAQLAEIDVPKRAELAKQAQRRYNDQVPSVVLEYDNVLEAYRSDKFAGFPTQPSSGGPIMEQVGYWSYYGATPASEGGSAGGGSNTGMWIGIGVAVLIVLGGGGVFLAKRGKAAEDRE